MISIPQNQAIPNEGEIFAVDKPAGISSFGVVHKIRRASGIQRVGHAGTLDPFAQGVLVIGLGRSATKLLGDQMRSDKEYIAEVRLGISTDTGDPTGKIIRQCEFQPPERTALESALKNFSGEIEQTPPIYSAIKIDGKRSYKMARHGETPELKPRPVHIHEIELLGLTPEGFSFRVVCGHGTYIRVLAEDIAISIGNVAHLVALNRTRVGEWRLEQAFELNRLLDGLTERKRSA